MYPDSLRAQSEALAQYQGEDLHSTEQRQLEELELAALAAAIASSEYESVQASAMEESVKLAARIQSEEVAAADKELATAMESSEQEAHTEQASRKLEQSVLGLKRSRTVEQNEGAWDCVQCTFTNQPYRRTCNMCKAIAPPNVLTFTELPSELLKFGLEIEIVVPGGKEDGYTLESLAESLTSMGPRVDFAGYTHETSNHWKIVTDASLQGQDGDLCFELVSPVLKGEGSDGLGSLRAMMDNVRKLGVATNASCGFHVHVDATHGQEAVPGMGTLKGLKRVAQCFVALENAFDLLVALMWDGNESSGRRTNHNRFCRSNRLAFGALSNRQRWERIASASCRRELVGMVNPQNNRYMKLNLTNITKPSRPSTFEFRHHGGVEELKEAEAWVRLIVRFCQRASSLVEESSACLLPEDATPKEELQALFALIDCAGLEQFFVVERRLFSDSRLHNRWTCRVCERAFVNSRALSQHSESTGH